MDKDKIKKSIYDFYDKIAIEKINISGDVEGLNKSLGYTNENLENIPEEAKLGLGCGNPTEIGKPQQGEIVADLGSGRGMDVFLSAKSVGDSGLVIGIDSNYKMVEKAREIAKKKDFKNTEFRLGEIEYLPIENNYLDLLISNCVINLSLNKEQVYKEIYRVLKIGGRISISDIILKKPLPEYIKEDTNIYGTWVGGAISQEEIRVILENIGFRNIEINSKEVTDEYARKWGHGLEIKKYIGSGDILAYK